MKRIVSLLLIICCMSALMASAVAPDWTYDKKVESIMGVTLTKETEKTVEDVIQKLLFKLDIIGDTGADTEAKAKREDFVSAVSKINGISAEEFASTVSKETSIKVSSGKEITLGEAVALATVVTGFTVKAEAGGGYPLGYMITASSQKLLRGISYAETQAMTVGEMNQLLYNMISVPTWEVVGVEDGEPKYGYSDIPTILQRRFDTVMVKGIVTAAGITGMYGASSLSGNKMEIDRSVYLTDKIAAEEYVGQSVVAFIQGKDEEKTVIAIEADGNEITKFATSEIIKTKSGKVELSETSVEYSDNTKIILNGMYYGTARDNAKQIFEKDADITATDNNADGITDVFVVWQYEHFVSEFDVGMTGTVALSYGAVFGGNTSIELSDEKERTLILTKDGEKIKYTDIRSGDVLSVAKSTDSSEKEYITVKVSGKYVSGAVESVREEGGVVFVTVKGETYKMTDNYKNLCGYPGAEISSDIPQPKVGKTYTFMLTAENCIAGIETDSASLMWGYLTKAAAEGGLSSTGVIRIFNADGKFESYEITKDIMYYDSNNMNGVKLSGREAVEKIRQPIESNPQADIRTMVKYSKNTDGELTSIYLPYDNTSGTPGSVKYPCTYDKQTDDNKYYHYKFLEIGWSTAPDQPLFIVPGYEERDKEYNYRISSLMEEKSLPANYTVKLYGSDEMRITEAALQVNEAGAGAQELGTQSMRTFIVDKAARALNNEDEEVLKIYGWENGKLVSADCKDFELESQARNSFAGGVKITDLKRGDVIQFLSNGSDGSIAQFRIFLQAENKGNHRYIDATGAASVTGNENMDNLKYYFGYVKYNGSSKKQIAGGAFEYINYSVGNYNYTSIVKSGGAMTNCIYYLVDSEDDEISLITLADLKPGENIVFTHSYFNKTFVVVYR